MTEKKPAIVAPVAKKPAIVAPVAPVAPVATPPVSFSLGDMGMPPRGGGSRGKAPFTGSNPASMPAVVVGRGAIDTMLYTMLALPDGVYASREQLATAAVGAQQARSGLDGSYHTARCQTGKQGSDNGHGLLFATGRASDGNVGYRIDKPASESRALQAAQSAQLAGGWGAAPGWLTRLVRDGFPWELAVDSPARAAGFAGYTPPAVSRVIASREVAPPAVTPPAVTPPAVAPAKKTTKK